MAGVLASAYNSISSPSVRMIAALHFSADFVVIIATYAKYVSARFNYFLDYFPLPSKISGHSYSFYQFHCVTVCPDAPTYMARRTCSIHPVADSGSIPVILCLFLPPFSTILESGVLHNTFIHYPRPHFIFAPNVFLSQVFAGFDGYIRERHNLQSLLE